MSKQEHNENSLPNLDEIETMNRFEKYLGGLVERSVGGPIADLRRDFKGVEQAVQRIEEAHSKMEGRVTWLEGLGKKVVIAAGVLASLSSLAGAAVWTWVKSQLRS